MKNFLLIVTIILGVSQVFAQEFNCQVNVQTNPKLAVSTTQREVLDDLKQAITDIMNETSWTKEIYEVEERINATFQLSVDDINGNNIKGSLQVNATRPVFNTSYNTTLINFLDKDVIFSFQRNTKIIFSENQYTDNLSSIMAFYAYYILGLDGDSFMEKGGSAHFRKAQNIVQLAQTSGDSGWKSDSKGNRNRYWLIENTLQELFSPLRECYFIYHRKGLDQMYNNREKARNEMEAALNLLDKVNNTRPGSVNITNFLLAKKDELKGIFQDSEMKQKTEVVNLLKRMDPSNASVYQEILQ